MNTIFLACPNYGSFEPETVQSIIACSKDPNNRIFMPEIPKPNSNLGDAFNTQWCLARNDQKRIGINRFAMIHADIDAEAGWVDKLETLRAKYNADIMAAIIAIKSEEGSTSTGIYDPITHSVERLSLEQLYNMPQKNKPICNEDLPDGKVLAINTGLWIVDFTKKWVHEFPGFEIRNAIVNLPNGTCEPRTFTEDWAFSKWAAEQKLRVFATTAVVATHIGRYGFRNDHIWGTGVKKR